MVWTTSAGAPVLECAQRNHPSAVVPTVPAVTTDPEPVTVGRFLTLEQVAGELAVSRAQV